MIPRFTTLTRRARTAVSCIVKCRAVKIRRAILWAFGLLFCYTIILLAHIYLVARNVFCTLLGVPIVARLVASWQHLGFCLSSKVKRLSLTSIPITDVLLLVREYHATYYVPHNLSLIVTGKLSSGTKSLLAVVQDKVEPNIISHGQNQGPRPRGWKRPFLETPSAHQSPIKRITKDIVEFPEKDESQGELIITYNGPSPTDFIERKVCDLTTLTFGAHNFLQALDILATYLTSSPVAPLNKEYIEIESPLW